MSQLTIKISDKADALIAQLQKEIFNRRRKKVSAEGVVETLLESGAKSQSDKRFATSWQNLVADIEKAAMVAQAHGAKPNALSDEEWALVLSHRTRTGAPGDGKGAARPRAATRATTAASKAGAATKASGATTSPRRQSKASLAKLAAAEVEALIATSSGAPKTRGTRGGAKAKPTRAAKATTTTATAAATTKAKAAPVARVASGRKRSSAAAASAPASAPASAAASAPASAAATETKAPAKTTSRKTSTARSSVARRMAKAASRLASAPIMAIIASPSPAPSPASVNGSNGVDSASPTPPPAL